MRTARWACPMKAASLAVIFAAWAVVSTVSGQVITCGGGDIALPQCCGCQHGHCGRGCCPGPGGCLGWSEGDVCTQGDSTCCIATQYRSDPVTDLDCGEGYVSNAASSAAQCTGGVCDSAGLCSCDLQSVASGDHAVCCVAAATCGDKVYIPCAGQCSRLYCS